MGNWKAFSPASPHKLLNGYVKEMADYTPRDGDATILEQEEEPCLTRIPTFDWDKLKKGKAY